MKYFIFLLCLTCTACFAQDHKAQIADFRQKYRDDFLTDKNSPLKKEDLQYLRFYDADSSYKVNAKAEFIQNGQTFLMPVFSGTGQQYVRYTKLTFELKGKPMELTVYRSIPLASILQYKDYLFLPFTDDTNGNTTYGGGRYIDMRDGDFKGNYVVIDFNKAYNPYCAFSANYSCPKPPDENHVSIAVAAGEKSFARADSH